ncbi:MAG: GIY-YIG nuclease family protein [Pseudomonadota bacterium]
MDTNFPVTPDAATSRQATQRELKRQYKEVPPPMGVFVIRNRASQRIYIGASTNVQGAINRARFDLQRKGHRNAPLQADWLACGEAGFSLEVLDTVKLRDDPAFDPRAELESLLALWREELGCDTTNGNCYNPEGARP